MKLEDLPEELRHLIVLHKELWVRIAEPGRRWTRKAFAKLITLWGG